MGKFEEALSYYNKLIDLDIKNFNKDELNNN